MEFKLFDSELKVMDILWKEGDTSAKEIAEKLNEQVGWSKTTTYTVIKKCIDKGAVGRSEPASSAARSFPERKCRRWKPTS